MSDDVRTDDQRTETSVLVAFGVATAGAVGFVVAYALDAGAGWMGTALSAAFLGLGYGLVAWGHGLMPPGEEVEERHVMPAAPQREQEVGAYLRERGLEVRRRGLLGVALATALGATGLAALVPLWSLGPRPGDALLRTAWANPTNPRMVTTQGRPVRADELELGGILTVFPEGHEGAADAQALLIQLGDVALRSPGRADWMAAGHVAYSKVCTHAGCPVGLYEAVQQTLFCPCHQSAFDVVAGASPFQGPATQPLPQLPLAVDDEGYLVATGDFSAPVGPGWWDHP